MDLRLLPIGLCLLMSSLTATTPDAPSDEAAGDTVMVDSSDFHGYDRDYMADWRSDWTGLSGRMNKPKCIDIPANLTLCRGIGYSQMRLPNLLDHDTIREVSQQAKSWVPLTNIQCHPDTKLFLCSLFSPICLDRPIPPCRTLCEAVRAGCESRMLKYGYPWPEMLRCDKFPPDNDLCISMRTHAKPDEKTCAACRHPGTLESIVDNFCNAEFVVKIQVRKRIRRKTETKLRTLKKKRIFKRVNISKKELRKALFYMDGGETCQCDELDAVGTPGKRHYLAMGQKRDGKLRLSFLRLMDKKNKEFQKAVRKIRRNEDICKGGVQMLTDDDAAEAAKKQQRQRDRKARRARKDSKRNGQRKDGKRNNGERKARRRKPKNRGATQRGQPT